MNMHILNEAHASSLFFPHGISLLLCLRFSDLASTVVSLKKSEKNSQSHDLAVPLGVGSYLAAQQRAGCPGMTAGKLLHMKRK